MLSSITKRLVPLSRAVQATWLEFHPKYSPLGKVEGGKFLEKENEKPVRTRLRRKWCQILRREGGELGNYARMGF